MVMPYKVSNLIRVSQVLWLCHLLHRLPPKSSLSTYLYIIKSLCILRTHTHTQSRWIRIGVLPLTGQRECCWDGDHMDRFMKELQSKWFHALYCYCLLFFFFFAQQGWCFAVMASFSRWRKFVLLIKMSSEGKFLTTLNRWVAQMWKMTLSSALAVLLVNESLFCLLLGMPFSNPLFFFQAISLLSTFEHENIVKYYGTYKVNFLP